MDNFDYLELLTLKACVEFTQQHGEVINLSELLNKLDKLIEKERKEK
jgi:Flp pilus assembly protein TadB